MTKRVAIMQPYFFPYAGYFRLFSETDEFVILDGVQFRREGRIHRAPVPAATGESPWLTLPLAYAPLETAIRDMRFAKDARPSFDARLARLPWIASASGTHAETVRAFLEAPLDSLVDYLERGLVLTNDLLGIATGTLTRSSSLDIDPTLRGQARVIAIAKCVGATHYVNSPGGRELYDERAFARDDLVLEFLEPYRGPHVHLLFDLMTGDPRVIGASLARGST